MIVHRLQRGLLAKRRALERAHPNQKIKVNGRKSLLEQHAISASQQKKLKDVCKQKQGGAFGGRPLAKKLAKILRIAKMSPDTARTMFQKIIGK